MKAHSVEENNNSAIDDVVQILTDLGAKYNIAIDAPHHTSKGPADPGNANRGRGARAMNNGGRLVYTLATMNAEEAQAFGISEENRKTYIRMDSGKVNIARALGGPSNPAPVVAKRRVFPFASFPLKLTEDTEE